MFRYALGDISDLEISALENYVQSLNKSGALSDFPSDSSTKLFLEANLLLKSKQENSSRFRQILEKLKNSAPDLYEKLYYRKLIKNLETGDPDAKKKAMVLLKDTLYYTNLDQASPEYIVYQEDVKLPSILTREMTDINLSNINISLEDYYQLGEDGK